jgi:hypothetical protein
MTRVAAPKRNGDPTGFWNGTGKEIRPRNLPFQLRFKARITVWQAM